MSLDVHAPEYAPPPLLERMVASRLFGRETGRGFHHHSGERGAA
jgi:3-hydroxyacyl-CoA dehydrogenase